MIILDGKIITKIEEIVKNYLVEECNIEDSLYWYQSAYCKTICMDDNLLTIYLVLLKHYPTRKVNSKILFYNNEEGIFIDDIFDFNLHALYHFDSNKLTPTNLKKTLNLSFSEIETIDYNGDGVNDYKFTRLWHIGTSNAIETTILSIRSNRVDTLLYDKTYSIELNL